MSASNDLHVHSSLSDGRETPAELVARAKQQGLSRLIITDHGRITLPRGVGVDPLLPFPGVELSTSHDGRRHHLLAFGPALLQSPVEELAHETLAARNTLADAVAASVGVVRGIEDYPSRTNIALGLARSLGVPVAEARSRVEVAWSYAESHQRRWYAPTIDTLAALVSYGAIVCLAHPLWQIRTVGERAAVLADLRLMKRNGLWGSAVRSYHSRVWDDDTELRQTITEAGLFTIGGSDYHGNGKTVLGSDSTTEAVFAELESAVLESAKVGRT